MTAHCAVDERRSENRSCRLHRWAVVVCASRILHRTRAPAAVAPTSPFGAHEGVERRHTIRCMSEPEVWLKGPIAGVPPHLQPVAHSLLQSREEIRGVLRGM